MSAEENRPAPKGEAAPKESGGSAPDNTPGGTGRATATLPSLTFVVREAAEAFLAGPGMGIADPAVFESESLRALNAAIARANLDGARPKELKLPFLRELPRSAVAAGLLHLYRWAVVFPPKSSRRGMLAVYQDSGESAGIYVADPDALRAYVRRLMPSADKREADAVLGILRDDAPRKEVCHDRDLVPVANGIFDYRSKDLRSFDPDVVFTAKLRTRLVFDAGNPVIGNGDGTTWDIERQIEEMSDGDPEWAEACWRLIGASVRPNVRWDKAAYLYDEHGETAKGTLAELLRGLHGDDSCSALAMADFAHTRKFRLIELVGKTLNVADENPVGEFADDLANFKATVTQDIVLVEAKNEQPFPLRPTVFNIQCINALPKTKDVSRSARRRQWFLPFTKSYTGRANKAIKADYVRRRAVLEYVLKKVLLDLPDYYELPYLEAGEKVADEARLVNDNVAQFWSEFADEFVWDLLPTAFLYDFYKAWFARVNPNGRVLNLIEFGRRLRSVLGEGTGWEYPEQAVRTGNRMDSPEPLIADYELTHWMNPVYRVQGGDPAKLCLPVTRPRYRGLLRVSAQPRTITVVNGIPVDLMPPTSTPEGAG